MRRIVPVLLLLVALGLAAGGCSASEDQTAGTGAAATTATATDESATTVDATATAVPTRDAFSAIPDVLDEVEPSVVTVFVSGSHGAGSGSGVIWDDQGRIVTNNHVVEGADQVEVQLATGVQLPARVIGTDERTDLAVVEVEREGLPAADFAETLPREGELAIAVGSPLGFANTASAGIVSALHRDLPSGGQTPALVDLLQTDAAISPGNSGGALVAGDGSVIGINVAYIPPEARAVSIGFAIPAPTVRAIVPELIESGHVEHAYLGIQPAPVTEELSSSFHLDVDSGVLVRTVPANTPADRAGIEQGDVIVALEGEPIQTVEDLFAALRDYKPGDSVTATLVRDEKRRDVDVELGRLPG
jgi:serine protease DegQ